MSNVLHKWLVNAPVNKIAKMMINQSGCSEELEKLSIPEQREALRLTAKELSTELQSRISNKRRLEIRSILRTVSQRLEQLNWACNQVDYDGHGKLLKKHKNKNSLFLHLLYP